MSTQNNQPPTSPSSQRLEAVQRAERGELLACPFCGDNNKRLPQRIVVDKSVRFGCSYGDPDAMSYFVRCRSCASQGPWKKSEHSAMVEWNIRLPPEGTK